MAHMHDSPVANKHKRKLCHVTRLPVPSVLSLWSLFCLVLDTDMDMDMDTDMACSQHFDFFVHFINVIKNLTNAHNLRPTIPTDCPSALLMPQHSPHIQKCQLMWLLSGQRATCNFVATLPIDSVTKSVPLR